MFTDINWFARRFIADQLIWIEPSMTFSYDIYLKGVVDLRMTKRFLPLEIMTFSAATRPHWSATAVPVWTIFSSANDVLVQWNFWPD